MSDNKNDLEYIMQEYVATANNPKYRTKEGKVDWDVVNKKFPELDGYDPTVLKEYVATANNPQYQGDYSIVNSKFEEIFPKNNKEEERKRQRNKPKPDPFELGITDFYSYDGSDKVYYKHDGKEYVHDGELFQGPTLATQFDEINEKRKRGEGAGFSKDVLLKGIESGNVEEGMIGSTAYNDWLEEVKLEEAAKHYEETGELPEGGEFDHLNASLYINQVDTKTGDVKKIKVKRIESENKDKNYEKKKEKVEEDKNPDKEDLYSTNYPEMDVAENIDMPRLDFEDFWTLQARDLAPKLNDLYKDYQVDDYERTITRSLLGTGILPKDYKVTRESKRFHFQKVPGNKIKMIDFKLGTTKTIDLASQRRDQESNQKNIIHPFQQYLNFVSKKDHNDINRGTSILNQDLKEVINEYTEEGEGYNELLERINPNNDVNAETTRKVNKVALLDKEVTGIMKRWMRPLTIDGITWDGQGFRVWQDKDQFTEKEWEAIVNPRYHGDVQVMIANAAREEGGASRPATEEESKRFTELYLVHMMSQKRLNIEENNPGNVEKESTINLMELQKDTEQDSESLEEFGPGKIYKRQSGDVKELIHVSEKDGTIMIIPSDSTYYENYDDHPEYDEEDDEYDEAYLEKDDYLDLEEEKGGGYETEEDLKRIKAHQDQKRHNDAKAGNGNIYNKTGAAYKYDDNIYDFEDFINFREDQLSKDFTKKLIKENANISVQYQKDYQKILNDSGKLKEFEKKATELHKDEIDTIEEELLAKYQELAKGLNDNERKDLQKEYEKERTEKLKPYLDKINDAIEEYIYRDEELKPILAKLEAEYMEMYDGKSQEMFGEYVKNWTLNPKRIFWTKDKLDDIGSWLNQEHNFQHLHSTEQMAVLRKAIDKFGGIAFEGLDDSMKAHAQNEFYSYFLENLYFSKTSPGQMTTFGNKMVLEDLMDKMKNDKNHQVKAYGAKIVNGEVVWPTREDLGWNSEWDVYRTLPEDRWKKDMKKIQRMLDYPEDYPDSWKKAMWRGFADAVWSPKKLPFAGAILDMIDSAKIFKISKKDEKDRTEREKQQLVLYTLDQALQDQVGKMSPNYSAGQMLADMPAFVIEMISTGSIYSTVRQSAQKLVKRQIMKGLAGQLVKTRFKKGTGKMIFGIANPNRMKFQLAEGVGDFIGLLAGTGAQTLANPGRYLDAMFENMTPEMAFAYTTDADDILYSIEQGGRGPNGLKDGDNVLKAFAKGFGTTWSEYFTERLGEFIPGLNTAMLRKLGFTGKKSEEFLKRLTLGFYMRKMGLGTLARKSLVVEHFLQNQIGWHGMFGEVAEELMNIPITNLIQGNPIAEGFDRENLEPMLKSIAVGSVAFGGMGMTYNAVRGNRKASWYTDDGFLRHKSSADLLKHLKRLNKLKKLNEDTNIEINNDYSGYVKIEKYLESIGLSGDIIKTGGRQITQSELTATEAEILNAIDDKTQRGRLNQIDERSSELEQEKQNIRQTEMPTDTKNQKLLEIQNELDGLIREKNDITSDARKEIESRKRKDWYVKGLQRLKLFAGKQRKLKTEVFNDRNGGNSANLKDNNKKFGEDFRKSELRRNGFEHIKNEDGTNMTGAQYKRKTGNDAGSADGFVYRKIEGGQPVRLNNRTLKSIEKLQKNAESSHGYLRHNNDGTKTIVINEAQALSEEGGNVNVASHEFLHFVLQEIVKNNPDVMLALGHALRTYINRVDPKQVRDTAFRQKLESYIKFPKSVQAEEALVLFSDCLAMGIIQYNENVFTKIGDVLRRIFQNYMGRPIRFRSGRDVFNFLKDYNRSFEKGTLSRGITAVMDRGRYEKTGRDAEVREINRKYEAKEDDVVKRFEEGKISENAALKEIADLRSAQEKEMRPIEAEFTKGLIGGDVSANVQALRDLQKEGFAEVGMQDITELAGPSVVRFSKSNLQGALDGVKKDATKADIPEFIRETMGTKADGTKIDLATEPMLAFTQSKFANEIGGLVESITKRLFDPIPSDGMEAIPGETRFDKREAYKNRLLTTAAELVMREYDPAKQNLDKFLSTRLSLRANKIATDMGVSSTFTKDIADIKESEVDAIMEDADADFKDLFERDIFAEQAAEAKARKKAKDKGEKFKGMDTRREKELVKVLDTLNIKESAKKKIINTVNKAIAPKMVYEGATYTVMEDASINISEKPTYKEIKEHITNTKKVNGKNPTKASDVKPTGILYPILETISNAIGAKAGIPGSRIAKKVLANQNFNKDERAAIQEYFNEHGSDLKQMLAEQHTVSGDATGVPSSLLKAFYIKGERAKYSEGKKSKGLPLWVKQDPISTKDFKESLGIKDGKFDSTNTSLDPILRGVILTPVILAGNQTVRESGLKQGHPADILGMIKDGTSKYAFSLKQIKTLGPKGQTQTQYKNSEAVFYEGLPELASEPKLNDIASIKDALLRVYGENGYNIMTKGQATVIAKGLKKFIDQWNTMDTGFMNNAKKHGGLTNVPSKPLLVEYLADNLLAKETKVLKVLNVKEDAGTMFDNKDVIDNLRAAPVAFLNGLRDKGMSPAAVLRIAIMMKPGYTDAGKIGRGNIGVRKNGNTYYKDIPKGRSSDQRYQGFESTDDYNRNVIGKIKGINLNKLTTPAGNISQAKVNKKFGENKDGSPKVNISLLSQSASDVLDKIEKIGAKDYSTLSENEAKEAQKIMKAFTEYYQQQIKDGVLDRRDLAAMLISQNSNLKSLVRRMAPITGFAEGLNIRGHKNYVPPGKATPKKVAAWMKKNGYEGHEAIAALKSKEVPYRNKYTIVFEHVIPANYTLVKMISDYIEKGGISKDFFKHYQVNIISKKFDNVIRDQGLQSVMTPDYKWGDPPHDNRYFGNRTFGNEAAHAITLLKGGTYSFSMSHEVSKEVLSDQLKEIDNFTTRFSLHKKSLPGSKGTKGASIWDFDDTIAKSKSNVLFTAPDGTLGKLTAEQFADQGAGLLQKGYKFDFSEFSKVVKGEKGPFFKKFTDRIKKFGVKDNFILTARPVEAAPAIQTFLKSLGVTIPLKNITALANSTANAKSMWIAENIIGKGYNDIYFADDALQNIEAVSNMFEQFDIKGKVQQAKMRFSKVGGKQFSNILDEGGIDLDQDFNIIIEETTKGKVSRKKEFSRDKARQRGRRKSKFTFFIPPSAEDFEGLCYTFLGKGKVGERHHKFFKEKLFDPFSKGVRALNLAKQSISNDMRVLRNKMPKIKKLLNKTIPGSDFTYEQAARVYIWAKNGHDMPGMSKKDIEVLSKAVEGNAELKAFANTVDKISQKAGGYTPPSSYWVAGNILTDLTDSISNARENFLSEWKENVDIIFSEKNLNKIESTWGPNLREALEDILWRMENGTNRRYGSNRIVNNFMDWINGSIGATMFINMRSAVLQTLSMVNFINWHDNNIFKAGTAFANIPQFCKDFSMIFNSNWLKQRRSGLQMDINANEMIQAIRKSKNPVRAAIGWLLEKGFKPTQIMDSFAIASGGATMYRNRVKTYLNQGLSKKQAEDKAFIDLQEVAEATQQSARPDRISQQQASVLGKLILAFQNTPMQYMRLTKKAALDLVNGRGDWRANISKIMYYSVVQNLIFYSLQSALCALMFGYDEDEDKREDAKNKKKIYTINGMLDSILRGTGITGAVVSTVKNIILEYAEQKQKWKPDHVYTVIEALNLSPPIGIKVRKFYKGLETWEWDEDVIKHMDKTDLDNPFYEGLFKIIEATTNVPLSRIHNKINNIRDAMEAELETWQRIALLMGWSRWNIGLGERQEILDIENEISEIKKIEKKKKAEEKKKIKEAEIKKQNLEQEKLHEKEQNKEKEEGEKDVKCIAVNKSGNRCGMKILPGEKYCTIHQKVEKRTDGKKVQCKKIKNDGKRCKMQTNNKSSLCYYHD